MHFCGSRLDNHVKVKFIFLSVWALTEIYALFLHFVLFTMRFLLCFDLKPCLELSRYSSFFWPKVYSTPIVDQNFSSYIFLLGLFTEASYNMKNEVHRDIPLQPPSTQAEIRVLRSSFQVWWLQGSRYRIALQMYLLWLWSSHALCHPFYHHQPPILHKVFLSVSVQAARGHPSLLQCVREGHIRLSLPLQIVRVWSPSMLREASHGAWWWRCETLLVQEG